MKITAYIIQHYKFIEKLVLFKTDDEISDEDLSEIMADYEDLYGVTKISLTVWHRYVDRVNELDKDILYRLKTSKDFLKSFLELYNITLIDTNYQYFDKWNQLHQGYIVKFDNKLWMSSNLLYKDEPLDLYQCDWVEVIPETINNTIYKKV